MDLLVIGSSGLLGSNVFVQSLKKGWMPHGTYYSNKIDFDEGNTIELDIRDNERIREIITENDIEAVVNCAALTDVDECERKPEKAYQVNSSAVGEIASICSETDTDFVHVSTDYVFDGDKETRYIESDKTNPIQVYGESKLEGEKLALEKNSDTTIARLSFVYGINHGKQSLEGVISWIRNKIRTNDDLPLFVDQHVTPTRAGYAADILLKLIENRSSGVFHLTCSSCVTPYEFGVEVHDIITGSRESDIIGEAYQSDIDREARRPENTCLSTDKIEEELGIETPTLREDLETLSEWL